MGLAAVISIRLNGSWRPNGVPGGATAPAQLFWGCPQSLFRQWAEPGRGFASDRQLAIWLAVQIFKNVAVAAVAATA